MKNKNQKKENTKNDELNAIKPELEKIIKIIKRASETSKKGTPEAKEEARNIMGEAQKICENVKNRLSSLIE